MPQSVGSRQTASRHPPAQGSGGLGRKRVWPLPVELSAHVIVGVHLQRRKYGEWGSAENPGGWVPKHVLVYETGERLTSWLQSREGEHRAL